MRRRDLLSGLGATAALAAAPRALAAAPVETPELAARVAAGELPPIAERLPRTPLVVDLAGRGRSLGRHGGEVRTLVTRARDLRYIVVNAYTELVGYDANLVLKPDLLERFEDEGGRAFTFTLREGHRWSDGAPFTAEDLRYAYEDVLANPELSPGGLPDALKVDGEAPRFEVLDARRVRYTWAKPNPRLMPALAGPRPLQLHSPAHYLKRFHAAYADKADLDRLVKEARVRGWSALHNRVDDPRDASNPDMPVLTPWRIATAAPANRFVFVRNPYYHRVDAAGRQLPYVDRIVANTAAGGLFAAKANGGEVDLAARGLSTSDVPILREGERAKPGPGGYRTLLWPVARGSAFALYPNLNAADPVWRALNRDARYRRALSLGIDRRIINNALLFGLGTEAGNTVMPGSALDGPSARTSYARFDPDEANRLLDEVGLAARDDEGFRNLPDGRFMQVIVEADGEAGDMVDMLQLVTETWRDIGVRLFIKTGDRTVLRNRAYSGQSVMVASVGLDNATPTPIMPPAELAPVRQDNYAWPKWGQAYETGGKMGEAPDLPEARRLLELFGQWMGSTDAAAQERAWREMLAVHASQVFVIGTVQGDLQPVVVARRLRNVPERATYAWEPNAMLGVQRVDEFYYAE